MLSSVLKSDKAIQTNIQIMRIFSKVRQMLLGTTDLKIDFLQIQKKLEHHDKNIELVFSYLDEFSDKKENDPSLWGTGEANAKNKNWLKKVTSNEKNQIIYKNSINLNLNCWLLWYYSRFNYLIYLP